LYTKIFYKPVLKLADWVAYLDWDLYDTYFINGFGKVTKFLSQWVGKIDYDGIDQFLVDGIGKSLNKVGKGLRFVQTGRVQQYVLFALTAIIILLLWKTV